MNAMQPIKLGIGNGSLAEPVRWLLSQIGITCDPSKRTAWQEIDNELVKKIFISRPQNLPKMLQTKQVDSVVMGLDMITEWSNKEYSPVITENLNFVTIATIQVSKTSLQNNACVVAFVRQDSRYASKKDLRYKKILSEYPWLTEQWLGKLECPLGNIINDVEITESYGSTESMVAAGVYDCGVGVTETGASLAANNLRILDTIMEAPVVMVVRSENINDDRLQQLADMLNGVHAAQDYVLIKMNAEKNKLPSITPLLPALKSPTVHELSEAGGVAVETVVQKNKLAALIVALRNAGAKGIIWHTLDGVIS